MPEESSWNLRQDRRRRRIPESIQSPRLPVNHGSRRVRRGAREKFHLAEENPLKLSYDDASGGGRCVAEVERWQFHLGRPWTRQVPAFTRQVREDGAVLALRFVDCLRGDACRDENPQEEVMNGFHGSHPVVLRIMAVWRNEI